MRMKTNPGKPVIFSRTDSIGDVMLTLPMMGIFKAHFPGAEIIFIGRTYTQPIAGACRHIDHFINWDEVLKSTPSQQVEIFRAVNAGAIIHVFPDRKVAEVARKAKIPQRIGTSHRLFHWYTCNHRIDFSRKNSNLHEAQLNLRLLNIFGINESYPLKEIKEYYGFSPGYLLPEKIKNLLDNSRFNLILHPKSKGSAREWGFGNFTKLIGMLSPEKYKIFITGTKEEGVHMKDFIATHPAAVDLAGKLTLEELIAFIGACHGMVAASTGPLHIAAALGKLAIGIYAPLRPIHPGRWAPVGKNAHSLVKEIKCSDCRKSKDCHCIREVTAEEVCRKIMEESPKVI